MILNHIANSKHIKKIGDKSAENRFSAICIPQDIKSLD